MNGVDVIKEQPRSVTPSSYLGKRKRSASPEKPQLNGITHSRDATVDNIVREIKQYDIAPSLLEHSLPKRTNEGPSIKKQRTDVQHDTIEGRLALEWYASTDDLLTDLRQAMVEVARGQSQVSGTREEKETSELRQIETLLAQYSQRPNAVTREENRHPISHAGEVLTVRSNVEGGTTKQLFTGLRLTSGNGNMVDQIDSRKLPNGFDIVEATALDTTRSIADGSARTFGDVFRQQRNARQLEPPKTSRGTSSTQLNFVKPFETSTTENKDDYRIAPLSTGTWLDYSATNTDITPPSTQRTRASKQDPQALFKAAFSSFAPSEDNTNAVVSRADRSRQWYGRYGAEALKRIMADEQTNTLPSTTSYPDFDDTYQQLIDEWEPIPPEDAQPISDHQIDENKDVLDEVSELLMTLSSYQRIRDLEKNRLHNTPIKPAGLEMETFELLRQQLKLLVSTLPPFALAKLDGNQLKALNVSTNILLRTPDTAGTGQPDEGTIHRARLAQAQQAAINRPTVPPTQRNSYTISNTPTATYQSQPRSYNANMTQTPSLPGYAQKNVGLYNTPRPGMAAAAPGYPQTPSYNRTQPPGPRDITIQQYQRMQNGYPSTSQTPYQPRTAQTPYQSQSQIQNNVSYALNATPGKPLTNGHHYGAQTPQQAGQPQRIQYSTPASSTNLLQGAYAQANSHATIQQIKAAQLAQGRIPPSQSQSPQPQPVQGIQQTNAAAVQTQQQRQASSTPQPLSQSQTPQPQHTVAATAPAHGATLNGVPGQIGPIVQSGQEQPQRPTPTPTPMAAGNGGA